MRTIIAFDHYDESYILYTFHFSAHEIKTTFLYPTFFFLLHWKHQTPLRLTPPSSYCNKLKRKISFSFLFLVIFLRYYTYYPLLKQYVLTCYKQKMNIGSCCYIYFSLGLSQYEDLHLFLLKIT